MKPYEELFSVIDETIGPKVQDDPGYWGSPMRDVWFRCKVARLALWNGKVGLARRMSVWITERLDRMEFLDATGTLAAYAAEVSAEAGRIQTNVIGN